MSTRMEEVNQGILLEHEALIAVRAEQEELARRVDQINYTLGRHWFEKHFRLREEFPLNYETDREALNDLVAFAKANGTGVTLLHDWIKSFNEGNERGVVIDWANHVPIQGEMPKPQLFMTRVYGEVDYDAKTEAASRLARAININGEARFSVALTVKRGAYYVEDYMVSGENYDQWSKAHGLYELDDPLLVPNPSYSLPVLLKELYEKH